MFYKMRLKAHVFGLRVVNRRVFTDREIGEKIDKFAEFAQGQGLSPYVAATLFSIRFLADQVTSVRWRHLIGAGSEETIHKVDEAVKQHLERLRQGAFRQAPDELDTIMAEALEDANASYDWDEALAIASKAGRAYFVERRSSYLPHLAAQPI